jgi:hypothetical protein
MNKYIPWSSTTMFSAQILLLLLGTFGQRTLAAAVFSSMNGVTILL